MDYEHAVHQLSPTYLYLRDKMPRCNTVGHGGGGKQQDRINSIFFPPLISSFSHSLYPDLLGHVSFLNNSLLTGDQSKALLKDWKSVYFLFLVVIHQKDVCRSYLLQNPYLIWKRVFCRLIFVCCYDPVCGRNGQIKGQKVVGPEVTSVPGYEKNQFSRKCFSLLCSQWKPSSTTIATTAGNWP